MSSAEKMFVAFHQREPRKTGSFADGLAIPARAVCVGDAVNVLYHSDKLNPTTGEDEGWIDYIHDHSRGVRVYRCDPGAHGPEHAVPAWLRGVRELTWLGDCLGFDFRDHDGELVKAQATRPLPELYTIPSGKALLVIQSKRTLLAMIWGGRLGVEPRGIVH